MEPSYETALYEARHAAMSESLNVRWHILIGKKEKYDDGILYAAQTSHKHVNGSMEAWLLRVGIKRIMIHLLIAPLV